MNILTRILLVLLRLAIGWHFLFEGWEKIYSVDIIGETTTNRPFTSAGFLSESTGPFAEFFRGQVRESDEEFLQRLTPAPAPPGQAPARVPPVSRFPPALAQEWQEYFDHFAQYYELDPNQKKLAEDLLRQGEGNTANWLLTGKKGIRKIFPKGVVEIEETIPQRVQDFRDKLAQVRDMETNVLGAFEKDVLKDKLRLAKAELNLMRKELQDDLNDQLAQTDKTLQTILNEEQKKGAPITELKPPAKALWIDRLTRYGLTAIGACLLLGLFTRTACVGGAAFLLLLYLAMPPFPWLPEPARTEGHYAFINKNLIEMLALLTLATTPSGRWAGLDALLHLLNPFRRRRLPGPDRENDSARRGSHDPADSADRRSPLVAGRPTVASGAGSGDPRTAQVASGAGSGDPPHRASGEQCPRPQPTRGPGNSIHPDTTPQPERMTSWRRI